MSVLPDFDALWNYQDPAGTEKAFRELLPLAESAGDRSYSARLLTQIGRSLGLQRKFAKAHQVLDEAEQLMTFNDPETKVRLLLERGRIFNSAGEKQKAGPMFIRAWEFASQHGLDFYAIDAAHMMGFMVAGSGMTSEKLLWEEKALRLAEASDSPKAKKWLGSLYNNIGWSYHEMGDFEKAKSMFEKCLLWQDANGKENGANIARWAIAKMTRLLGKSEDALRKQLDLLDRTGGEDPAGYTLEEIAECYMDMGKPEEAARFARKAWEKLSKDGWLTENEPERIQRLKKIGNT